MKHKLYPAVIALCIGMLSSACSGRPSEQTEPTVSAAEATEAALSPESPVETETDKPLPDMLYARDKLFVSTGRKAILTCGTADGNITSVTAPNQEPSENGQANFGSVGVDYVSAAEHAMAVEIDGSYILFLTPGWTEYQGQYFSEEELSPDTLKWLDNYYSLSEEEQLAISYIPSELIRQEEPPLVTEPN
ncbi:hypothetical protein [Eisenbergiella sp.]